MQELAYLGPYVLGKRHTSKRFYTSTHDAFSETFGCAYGSFIAGAVYWLGDEP